jgi:hypothetical protein
MCIYIWGVQRQSRMAAGLDGKEDVLLPLSQSAKNTLFGMAKQSLSTNLRVSPFCYENMDGAHEVRGWALELDGTTPASLLPMPCSLFDGMSMVECQCGEAEVLNLLTHPEQTRGRLGEAIHGIMSQVEEPRRATWRRCRPTENGVPQSLYSAFMGRDNRVTLCSTPDNVPLIDSEPWVPELSPEGFLGLYHHWHPTRKRLCLYMVCHSYLPKACLEFADLVRDLGDTCTALDVLHSEEVQWLRQACSRNRARLLSLCCEAMKLRYPAMLDYNSASGGLDRMAVVTTETVHHDLQMLQGTKKSMRLLNYCASTGRAPNGILCCMAPWEGVWVFHGSRGHDATFGLPYGALLMPTMAPQVPQHLHETVLAFTTNASHTNLEVWEHQRLSGRDTHHLLLQQADVELWSPWQDQQLLAHGSSNAAELARGEEDDPEILAAYRRSISKALTAPSASSAAETSKRQKKRRRYLLFDEQVLQAMAKKGWSRALGYTALVPLACGQCEEWWKHKQQLEAERAGEIAHVMELGMQ